MIADTNKHHTLNTYKEALEFLEVSKTYEGFPDGFKDEWIETLIKMNIWPETLMKLVHVINSYEPVGNSDFVFLDVISWLYSIVQEDGSIDEHIFKSKWVLMKRPWIIKEKPLYIKDCVIFILQYEKYLDLEQSMKYPFEINEELNKWLKEKQHVLDVWINAVRKLS
jgi:hypothetical protein